MSYLKDKVNNMNNSLLKKIKAERVFYKSIGYLIYTARRLRKFTQADVAKELNLSRKTITNIESGSTSIKLYDYVMMCDYFNINYTMVNYVKDPIGFEQTITDLIEGEKKRESSSK